MERRVLIVLLPTSYYEEKLGELLLEPIVYNLIMPSLAVEPLLERELGVLLLLLLLLLLGALYGFVKDSGFDKCLVIVQLLRLFLPVKCQEKHEIHYKLLIISKPRAGC